MHFGAHLGAHFGLSFDTPAPIEPLPTFAIPPVPPGRAVIHLQGRVQAATIISRNSDNLIGRMRTPAVAVSPDAPLVGRITVGEPRRDDSLVGVMEVLDVEPN